MTVFKCFSFINNRILKSKNLLCSRNTIKCGEEQRSLSGLSNKTLEKLGVPLPPKRPISPYLKFIQTVRSSIKENNPELKPNDLIKLIAKEWSKYDPEKKKILQDEYVSEMKVYVTKFEKYKETITPEQKDLISNTKQRQKHIKEQLRISEKKENLGKPKKPPSPFIKFMLERKDQKDNNVKYSEWLKVVGKEWENMSEADKEKYKQEVKLKLEKYKTDLLTWEENMIRQGHVDVVRNKELIDLRPIKKKTNKTSV